MRNLFLCLTMLLVSAAAFGSISIVMKGYFTPVCDGLAISKHTRLDKAFVAAINHGGDCDILPPVRYEIRLHNESEPVAETKDIYLSWSLPNENEDGSTITSIDRFNLYWGLAGSFQNVIQVEATSVNYTLANVSQGTYSFYMTTVSGGVEGNPSASIIEIVE